MPTEGLDDPDDVQPLSPKSRPGVIPKRKWRELGYEDPVVKGGRWRFFYYDVRERDPLYYDPMEKNAVVGLPGSDSLRAAETKSREMPGRTSHEEWLDRRYFLNSNVREIYENYPIAKQHPGLAYRPTGYDSSFKDKSLVGGVFPSFGLIRQWPGVLPRGWKFMAAPFGEQCHVKTAVCAQWGLFGGTFWTASEAIQYYVGAGWRKILERWLLHNSYSVSAAAAWGATSCIACNLRGKDDPWNMVAGGLGLGSVIGSRQGFFIGCYATTIATVLGIIWYYGITYERGVNMRFSGTELTPFSWDPHAYKWAVNESWGHPKPKNY